MTKGLVTIDRKAARAIAEELFALMSEEMGKIKPADIVPDEYFNVKQAAEFLGWSVHTVRHKKDEIPHSKVGGSLRFSRKDLVKYIRQE